MTFTGEHFRNGYQTPTKSKVHWLKCLTLLSSYQLLDMEPAAGFGAVKSSHFLLCQTKVTCLAVAPCRILQGCHFRGWKSWWLDADVWCGLLIFGGMVHESSSSWHSSQANRPWDWTHSNISPGTLVMEFWDTRRFAMHNPPRHLSMHHKCWSNIVLQFPQCFNPPTSIILHPLPSWC